MRISLSRISSAMIVVAMALLMSVGASRAGDEKQAGGQVGRDVGQIAPDIVGHDVNGKDLKLSDFRGKIVVLDFFGDW